MKSACVITIGNEILKGRTVNSNAAFIGKFLTNHGYEVNRGFTVKDDPGEIKWAVENSIGKYDLVVSTGGLGPTFDDMTVESVAKALGLKMVEDDGTKQMLLKRYRELGAEATPERLKLALVPEGSHVIRNRVGAAPGIFLSSGSSSLLILPGVPKEMEAILDDSEPLVGNGGRSYAEENRHLAGVMESSMVPIVNEIMARYDGGVYIKTHPLKSETNEPEIDIEVSAYGTTTEEAEKLVSEAINELVRKAESLRR